MKAFLNTFAIAAVSLFLCAAAPARPFQEPEKDKQQEPEKQKPEEQPKPEKERSADAERKPQQQEEKKPDEERKPEPNRQPQENQQERDRAAHQDNSRQEHPESNGKLTERTGRHNSFRIPDDRFRAGFGSGHRFHVRRGEREFGFGGFRFEFVDPWPAAWSYDDDCYIEFIDGEYYLVDAVHPGVRVLVIVVS